MNKSTKFSPEVRERAVRMVLEHRGEYPSLWTAVESIAPKIGCVPQTLLTWVQRHEIDTNGSDEEVARLRRAYDEAQTAAKALSRHNEAAIKAVLKQRTQQHANP